MDRTRTGVFMTNRVAWIEREFNFDFPASRYTEFIEELKATPGIVEEFVAPLSAEVLVRRQGDAWSIQENVGHLSDLEEIWAGRLSDFEAGASELRPADVSNRVTHLADHNSRAIDDLLSSFRFQREKFLARLGKLSEDDFSRAALHGRLNVQMRLVDMLYFIAEHDDHHLDRMRSLSQEFS